jgi:hypothetical protein
MLRVRLATNLLFNVLLAIWVLHDARTRRARKPLFAAALTLLWGPLGLGLWASDRPLAPSESRPGTGRTIARTFVLGWTAMLPALYVLLLPEMADRAAVPGSVPQRLGIAQAAGVIALGIWAGPAVIAWVLGSLGSAVPAEQGTGDVRRAMPPLGWAVALAGLAALAFAFALSR